MVALMKLSERQAQLHELLRKGWTTDRIKRKMGYNRTAAVSMAIREMRYKGVEVEDNRAWPRIGRPPGGGIREDEISPRVTQSRIAGELEMGERCRFCWLRLEGEPCDCRRAVVAGRI